MCNWPKDLINPIGQVLDLGNSVRTNEQWVFGAKVVYREVASVIIVGKVYWTITFCLGYCSWLVWEPWNYFIINSRVYPNSLTSFALFDTACEFLHGLLNTSVNLYDWKSHKIGHLKKSCIFDKLRNVFAQIYYYFHSLKHTSKLSGWFGFSKTLKSKIELKLWILQWTFFMP